MKCSVTNLPEIRKFFVIFYLVGTVGMLVPQTRGLFIALIPCSLLLNLGYLIYFHPKEKGGKTLFTLTAIAILTFMIEMVGVNTGFPFGAYTYLHGLGIQWQNTPLLIGINWVILLVCTASVAQPFRLQVIVASLLMVGYDLVLEIAAPKLEMWSFELGAAPWQNYASWFGIALLFHCVIKYLHIPTRNPIAATILFCQLLFLSTLALLLPCA